MKVLKADETQGVATSLGIVGPTIGGAIIVANALWGIYVGDLSQQIITDADVDQLLEAGNGAVTAVGTAIAVGSGIYGRYRAERNLRTGKTLETVATGSDEALHRST